MYVQTSLGVALAGLLRHVGKLYQRAYWGSLPEGVSDWSYPAYTKWAIDKWSLLFGGNAGWLAQTATRHHEGWHDKPQTLELAVKPEQTNSL